MYYYCETDAASDCVLVAVGATVNLMSGSVVLQ